MYIPIFHASPARSTTVNFEATRLLLFIFCLVFALSTQVACTTTLGAPEGDETYEVESATEAMEEEEEEDAWRDINR
jgi:hypothetical protein